MPPGSPDGTRSMPEGPVQVKEIYNLPLDSTAGKKVPAREIAARRALPKALSIHITLR